MRIACLGFGQVGSTFAPVLADRGAEVLCFDPRIKDPDCQPPNVTFGSFPEVLAGADVVLSMVTTEMAQDVAKQSRRHLRTEQVYVDLSSTAPSIEKDIADAFSRTDAIFVEGAILGAVAATGAKTRILLGGYNAGPTADLLNRYGLNCEPYREEIGAASSFKMLRSVFSKGVEAVLIETLLAAERGGVRGDIWSEICGTFETVTFEKMARTWITSHAVACKRRRDEMFQVEDVVRNLGLNPIMSSAAREIFERSTDKGLDGAFDEPVGDVDTVIAWLSREL